MKKIFKLIFIFLSMLTVTTLTLGNPGVDVQASGESYVEYEYKLYRKEDYEEYKNMPYLNLAAIDSSGNIVEAECYEIPYSEMLVYFEQFNTIHQGSFSDRTKDELISEIPDMSVTATGTLTKAFVNNLGMGTSAARSAAQSLQAIFTPAEDYEDGGYTWVTYHISSYSQFEGYINLLKSKAVTEVQPGDSVVLEVYSYIYLDGEKVLMLSAGSTIDMTGYGPTDSSQMTYYKLEEKNVKECKYQTDSYITGFNDDGNPAYSGESIGAFGFDVTASNDFTVQQNLATSTANTYTYFWADGEISSVTYSSSQASRFHDNPLTITVAGKTADTGLASLSVNSNSIDPATLDSNLDGSGKKGCAVDIAATATSIPVQATVINSGTVNSYGVGTTAAAAIADVNSNTVTGGAFNVDVSSVATGADYYAAFKVQSSDLSTYETYVIKLTKAKSNKAELTDFILVSSDSTASPQTLKLTNSSGTPISFSSGVTAYTILVDSLCTKVKFELDYAADMTGSVGGTALASGVQHEVNATGSFIVKILAQDGTTYKDYTFTFDTVSADTTLTDSVITPSVISGSTSTPVKGTMSSNTLTITGYKFEDAGFKLKIDLPNGATATYELNDGSGPKNVNDNVDMAINFNSPSGNYAQYTENIEVVVTSAAGTTETYYINVVRDAADTDTSLASTNPISVIAGSNTIIATWDAAQNAYVANTLKYSDKNFNVKVDLGSSFKQYEINGNGSKLNSGATSGDISTGYITGTGADAATSTTVMIKVYAQDRSQTQEYKLIVNRAGASTNVNVSGIYVVIGSNTYPATLGADGNYTISQKAVYTDAGFKVRVDLDDSTTQTAVVKNPNLNLTSGSNSSVINFDPSGFSAVSKTIVIKVTSEGAAATQEYTVVVDREEANKDSSFATFTVYADKNKNGTLDADDYIIGEIDDIDASTGVMTIDYRNGLAGIENYMGGFSVDATATNSLSNIKYFIGTSAASKTVSYSNTTTDKTETLTVKCTAQDTNEVTEVKVTVTRLGADDQWELDFGTSTVQYTHQYDLDEVAAGTLSNDIAFTLTSGTKTYATTVRYSANTFSVSFTTKISTSVIKSIIPGSGTNAVIASDSTNPDGTHTYVITGDLPNTTNLFTIKLATEATTAGHEVKVSIAKEAAETLQDFTNITADFEALDSTGNKIWETENYNSTSKVLSYTIYESDYIANGNTFDLEITPNGKYTRLEITQGGNVFDYAGKFPCDINDVVQVKIIAQNTASKSYSVKFAFVDTRSTVCDITDIEFTQLLGSYTYNASNYTYTITDVPYDVTNVDYKIVLADNKSSLVNGGSEFLTSTIGNVPLTKSGTTPNVFKVRAQAENNSFKSQIYTFNIYRNQANTNADLLNLKIDNINCEVDNATYFPTKFTTSTKNWMFIHPNTALTDINVSFSVSAGAKFSLTSSNDSVAVESFTNYYTANLVNNEVVLTISIWSEFDKVSGNSATNTYKITIYNADQDTTLKKFELMDSSGTANVLDVSGNTFNKGQLVLSSTFDFGTFTVPYSVATIYALVEANNAAAKLTYSNPYNLTPNADTLVEIVVTSQLGQKNSTIANQTKTYKVKVHREEADAENRLDTLSIKYNGTELLVGDDIFNSDTYNYVLDKLEYVSGATSLDIKATAKSNKANIAVPGGSVVTAKHTITTTVNVDFADTTSITNISITVTPEDPDTPAAVYQIRATSGSIDLSDVKDVKGITANSASSTGDLLDPGFSQTTTTYNVKVPVTDNKVTFGTSVVSTYSTMEYSVDNGVTWTKVNSNIVNLNIAESESKKVIFRCEAEDGSKGTEYIVFVSRDKMSDDARLSSISVNGKPIPDFNPDDTEYDVYLTNDVTTAYLDATAVSADIKSLNITNSASNPLTLAPGKNTTTVVVTAQNGTPLTYIVNIYKDDDLSLKSLDARFEGVNKITSVFNSTTYNYSALLEFGMTTLDVVYTLNGSDSNVTVTVTGATNTDIVGTKINNIPVGDSEYYVTLTGTSGATTKYTIKVTRAAGSSDNTIATYEDNGVVVEIEAGKFDYSYVIPRNKYTYAPVITLSNSKATYTLPSDMTLSPGALNTKVITVTSENGVPQTYTFKVYTCEDVSEILDINALVAAGGADLLDIDGTKKVDFANGVFDIKVPFNAQYVYLEVLLKGTYSKTFVNGTQFTNSLIQLEEGENKFEIYALSEYGFVSGVTEGNSSPKFTVTITRKEANKDTSLKSLSVSYIDEEGNPQEVKWDPASGSVNLAVENIGGVSSIVIKAESNMGETLTTITGIGNKTLASFDAEAGEGYSFTFPVVCTSKDDSQYFTEYNVIVSRGKISLDDDNTITSITLYDAEGNYYIPADPTKGFDDQVTEYGEFLIPYTTNSYTIIVTTYGNGTIYIDNVAANNKVFSIALTDRGNTKNHVVYCTSANGAKGTEYSIKLRFDKASDDATLSDLTVDGVTIEGFDPTAEGGTYTLPKVPNNISSIDLGYVLNDPNAKASGDFGTLTLDEGLNTFVITVTAADGVTTNTYKINVTREKPKPYATNIEIVGEQILNTSDKATTFDKDTTEYHFILANEKTMGTIKVTVDTEEYSVSVSNSVAIETTGTTRTFNAVFPEGTSRFIVQVVSLDGLVQAYTLVVQRRVSASSNTNISKVEIVEIPEFKEEYNNLTNQYHYTVPNKITSLTVNVIPEKISDAFGDGAKVDIFNEEYLEVGENEVVILVTSEDGNHFRAIVVYVTREKMQYTVDENATEFECSKVENEDNTYEIDLKDKTASAIEDYAKYIVTSDSDNVSVEVLSNVEDEKCNEVVVKITDGSETEYVKFKLKTTANTGGYTIPELIETYFPWILLLLGIILLIIILVCVNRDKYGAINSKRKNQKK